MSKESESGAMKAWKEYIRDKEWLQADYEEYSLDQVQEAFEAGQKAERERILKIVQKAINKIDCSTTCNANKIELEAAQYAILEKIEKEIKGDKE